MFKQLKQAVQEYIKQNREDHLNSTRQWQNGPTEIFLHYKKSIPESVKDKP